MRKTWRKRWLVLTIACGAMVGGGVGVVAPARGQSYPLLEEINRQTQSLYRDVQAGIVRVQLPVPRWVQEAAASEDPLRRWEKVIDPAVKQKLEQQRALGNKGVPMRVTPVVLAPTTRPAAAATRPAKPGEDGGITGWTVTRKPGSNETILEPRGGGSASITIHAGGDVGEDGNLNLGGPLRVRTQAAQGFVPNNIGLLLDDAGHVMVPLYVERETIGDSPVRVMVQDVETTASFVGSDDKTNVTILKLAGQVGRPVRMSPARPADGSLVMVLNPNNATGRLSMWTGGERDYGVVVAMDGSVAGVARYGQFVGGAAAQVVVDQLIKVGSMQRAILGARLTEVRRDDPARRAVAGLGEQPALAVDEVTPDSLAENAGLRRGDFILQIGEVPVGDLTTFAALSARSGPTRLVVLRAGEQIDVTVDLRPGE
jgi:hypothetical protein